MKLFDVRLDRLCRRHIDGLLCIGDAAHGPPWPAPTTGQRLAGGWRFTRADLDRLLHRLAGEERLLAVA